MVYISLATEKREHETHHNHQEGYKQKDKNKCWQGCWNPHTLGVGMQNGAVTLENSLAVPQKIKQSVWPCNFTPKYLPRRNGNIYSHKTCTCMFTVVLFVITKMQKQPRHLPTDERVKRDTSIHVEYYLVIKRSTDTSYNMEDAWKHFAKWKNCKKSITRLLIVWFH